MTYNFDKDRLLVIKNLMVKSHPAQRGFLGNDFALILTITTCSKGVSIQFLSSKTDNKNSLKSEIQS